jgi:hypothetical protein
MYRVKDYANNMTCLLAVSRALELLDQDKRSLTKRVASRQRVYQLYQLAHCYSFRGETEKSLTCLSQIQVWRR